MKFNFKVGQKYETMSGDVITVIDVMDNIRSLFPVTVRDEKGVQWTVTKEGNKYDDIPYHGNNLVRLIEKSPKPKIAHQKRKPASCWAIVQIESNQVMKIEQTREDARKTLRSLGGYILGGKCRIAKLVENV